ncbi:MAG: hypothetical protein LM590_09390 [Thermofilum sp.]|jgi:hypothetical protein|nr:hypothetical protein [Thermofilum sp.]
MKDRNLVLRVAAFLVITAILAYALVVQALPWGYRRYSSLDDDYHQPPVTRKPLVYSRPRPLGNH